MQQEYNKQKNQTVKKSNTKKQKRLIIEKPKIKKQKSLIIAKPKIKKQNKVPILKTLTNGTSIKNLKNISLFILEKTQNSSKTIVEYVKKNKYVNNKGTRFLVKFTTGILITEFVLQVTNLLFGQMIKKFIFNTLRNYHYRNWTPSDIISIIEIDENGEQVGKPIYQKIDEPIKRITY
jgi:hypothetical protein